MDNKQKGDLYEIQICNKLINDNNIAYLWKYIPEEHLIKANLISSQDEIRINRQKYKQDNINYNNPLIDIGVDILQITNNKYIFVQCKNGYENGVRMDDLSGFFCRMAQNNLTDGHVYFTSYISTNVLNIQKNDRIKFFRIPFINDKTLINNKKELNIFVPSIGEIEKIFCKFLLKNLLFKGNKKCVLYCSTDKINEITKELIDLNNNYYYADYKICNKNKISQSDKIILVSDTIINIQQDCIFFTETINKSVDDLICSCSTINNIYYWCSDYKNIKLFNNKYWTKIHVLSSELEYDKINLNVIIDEEILNKQRVQLIVDELHSEKPCVKTDEIYNLRNWQNDLVEYFLKFISSDDKTGVVISPTGAGKSFMMIYMSLLYMQLYDKDVMLITQRKDILDGLKDAIIKHHKIFVNSKLLNITENETKIIDNTDGKYTKDILNNNSKKRRLYIFNNSKFLTSSEFEEYELLNYGKIGLICDDECHNSGANKMFEFLTYIKNKQNIKLIGFSATPARLHELNKNNSLDIYGDKTYLNIIFERSYVECLEDNDIVPVIWNIFKLSNNDVINDTDVENIENIVNIKSKQFWKLNKNGKNKILNHISNEINKSVYKKGIFYFETIKSLLEFYKYFNDNCSKYKSFVNIKLFCTFCNLNNNLLIKYKLHKEEVIDAIKNFKNADENAILFAVNRACEGFDDKKCDFGMRLYIANQTSPLLEYQRMGRFARICKNKTKSYYTSIELDDIKNIENNYITRYANWVSFINTFGSVQSRYGTKKIKVNDNKIITIEKLFDLGTMTEIDISLLKDKIKERMTELNNTRDLKNIIKKIDRLDVMTLNCDFWKTYDGIQNKEYYGLPTTHNELYSKFKTVFDEKSWYEIFNYDTSCWYQTIDECKKALIELTDDEITDEKYVELCKLDLKLPPCPVDFFKQQNFDGFWKICLKKKKIYM